MARQEIILGTAPTGLGGDPPRTASTKINAMTAELYARDAALGTASNKNVQTSILDTTPGAILAVGAFGQNGGFASVQGVATNLNTLITPAVYACNSTYSGGPAGVSGPVYVIVISHGPDYVKQDLRGITDNKWYTRDLVASAWQPWVPVYTEATAVGTVASGALFERSENANGSFTKFADGRMVCTGKVTTDVVPANTRLGARGTYPAAFAPGSTPVFSGEVRATVSADHYGVINGDYTGAGRESGLFFTVRNGPSAQAFDFYYMAMGVWK